MKYTEKTKNKKKKNSSFSVNSKLILKKEKKKKKKKKKKKHIKTYVVIYRQQVKYFQLKIICLRKLDSTLFQSEG